MDRDVALREWCIERAILISSQPMDIIDIIVKSQELEKYITGEK